MSHKTILGGFAAAAVGLSMLGGALPASAGDYNHHDDKGKCSDVDFFRHRGHWDVTWDQNGREHREHARTYRDAVDELKDHCDRFENHRDRDHDRGDHRDRDHDRGDHRDRDHDRGDHRDRDHDRGDHRDHDRRDHDKKHDRD